MLSSSPASCTSPNPDKENPSKKVRWAFARRRTSSTDSESKSQSDPVRPRSRKPSRLTVKYDRGQLQRWVEMEQWVDTQVQELFQVLSFSWETARFCDSPSMSYGWNCTVHRLLSTSWPGSSEPHVIPTQDQPTSSEPEIDLEALMELSTEEQKTQLEALLQNCPRPTEPFISELLSQLKKLRRLSRPQK
ncbi:protein phosphatase 1 regulatory subunit 14D isoform X1 [Ovis aries]|uniref:protein phosphatase 1 regulatory subunit 14D isoform X1 n=1 Tax=Ovis aries TaxID=9940 RepID=UPI001C2E678D|nr:protein phosphatase 1 regulatory subunit 14D isoform X1 [Ovis aries]